MNCRVCNQPLSHLLTYENMPARAQMLSDEPVEDSVTLDLCQCRGCGLVQLINDPVEYWQTPIRTDNAKMDERIKTISEGMDFVSCNVLEHQPDPNKYLAQFECVGVIEVPNFDMILEKRLFAEIMLDHLLYFTEQTLRFTLTYNGFDVLEVKSVWNDYILSAMVRRREDIDMNWKFELHQAKMKRELDAYISKHGRVAIYGASHEALAYIAMLEPKVQFVVDDSLLKQGKYTPVGGLRILPPAVLKYRIPMPTPLTWHDANDALTDDDFGGIEKYDPPDAIVIMGAGYSDEIANTLEFDGSVAIMRDWGVEVVK